MSTARQDELLARSSETTLDELTIRDIDEALVEHFKAIFAAEPFVGSRPVPVRFMAGERWALDRDNLIKDADGRIALPMVVIERTEEVFPDIANLPGDAEEIVLSRRLHAAGSQEIAQLHQNGVDKMVQLGDFKSAQTVDSTSLMPGKHEVLEFVVASFPSFVDFTYTFTFKTNTVREANRMKELFMRGFKWRGLIALGGSKGQTYQAKFDGSFAAGASNIKDSSGKKRVIETEGAITVFGWLVTRPKIVRKHYDSKTRKGFSRIRWQTEEG